MPDEVADLVIMGWTLTGTAEGPLGTEDRGRLVRFRKDATVEPVPFVDVVLVVDVTFLIVVLLVIVMFVIRDGGKGVNSKVASLEASVFIIKQPRITKMMQVTIL